MAEKKKKSGIAKVIKSLFGKADAQPKSPEAPPAASPTPAPASIVAQSSLAGPEKTAKPSLANQAILEHPASGPIMPLPDPQSPQGFELDPLPPPGPGEPALPISHQRKTPGPKLPKLPLPQPVTQDQETRIGLLVREPQWVFAYWEISPNDQKSFGLDDTFRTPRLMLRVYQLDGDAQPVAQSEFFFDIGLQRHVRAWYIEPPREGRGWRAALGILRETGRFEAMCLSNFVQAPPAHAAVDSEGNPWQGPERGMPDLNDPEKIAEIFRLSIGEGLPPAMGVAGAPTNPAAAAPWTGPLSPMPLKAPAAQFPAAGQAGESSPGKIPAGHEEAFRPFAAVGGPANTSSMSVPLTIPGLAPSSEAATGGPVFPGEAFHPGPAPLQVPFTGSSNLTAGS